MTYLYLPSSFDVSVFIGDVCIIAVPVILMSLLVAAFFLIKKGIGAA